MIVEINQKTRRVEIEEMDAHEFRTWVEVEAQLVCYRLQFGKHGAFKVKATMGVDMAMTCLRSVEFRRQQPQLLRVNMVRLPIQRKDGRWELLPNGYDEVSGILTFAPDWEYDETMPLETAVHILDDLDSEFPFQDARSRAVFRAALVSQYGYFLQPLDAKRLNFLFHATGNGSGTGKTLLVEILLTIAWMYASVDSMPDDTGKMRDRLDTAVREAKPYVLFDDLEQGYLKSGMLNAFMTATWWSGRKFHAQEEFMEPKSPVVFLTANGLDISPDISRRVLTCDLFTPEADLQERKIKREIDAEWIRSDAVHQQLCSALWTVIRAWRDSNREYDGRVIRGYESWSRIFGAICMHAGFGDPCGARESDSYGNSEFNDMTELVSAMAEGVEKATELEFSDVVAICREHNCFAHIIKGKLVKRRGEDGEFEEFVASDECNSSLGKQLARYGGKTFVTRDGRRVIFDKRGKNRQRRYLIQVAAAAPK